jgi:hypothetical protein
VTPPVRIYGRKPRTQIDPARNCYCCAFSAEVEGIDLEIHVANLALQSWGAEEVGAVGVVEPAQNQPLHKTALGWKMLTEVIHYAICEELVSPFRRDKKPLLRTHQKFIGDDSGLNRNKGSKSAGKIEHNFSV